MQNGRYIEWKDGVPYPAYREPVTKAQMSAILNAALALEYEPINDPVTGELAPGEENYIGMMNIEVMAIKRVKHGAQGDFDSTQFVFDRVLGKPKQQVESVNVGVTFEEWMKTLPAPTEDDMPKITVRDVTPRSLSDMLQGI